ncbi:TIGR01777 family oxidoreductase [Chitinophaga sp. GCM10012297]|uniref:TIGR01777 family oxidoreductase n=1 Tax=Chitinophaga chungangae TaxID=2821488 RepID=A0ABS3YCG6_9BACT|nr:TIGR01777 family oxidoreductase [Chitinophaga chungangae]MBO9152376.1 TIGR01777 family oxidoreductase [Chitinophaga chungangae]
MKETVLITGGTGLVGQALTSLLLERGYQVTIFTRGKKRSDQRGLTYAQWDPARKTLDITALQAADYIIHLAGANVADSRWTAKRKQEIVDSRVESANLLFDQLRQHPNKVKKVISASATGWYGEYTGKIFTENDPAADDFLGITCKAWENSVRQMESLGKTVIILRTGIVLSLNGGAIREFRKPARFGFATVMGNGEQFVSWIHLQDLVRLYHNALLNDQLHGVYNAVAPRPVTNLQLVQSLARAMKGNSFITVHVPAFALKLALGEMSTEVLKSVKVSSEKIQQTGFVFSYPDVDSAVEQLVTHP